MASAFAYPKKISHLPFLKPTSFAIGHILQSTGWNPFAPLLPHGNGCFGWARPGWSGVNERPKRSPLMVPSTVEVSANLSSYINVGALNMVSSFKSSAICNICMFLYVGTCSLPFLELFCRGGHWNTTKLAVKAWKLHTPSYFIPYVSLKGQFNTTCVGPTCQFCHCLQTNSILTLIFPKEPLKQTPFSHQISRLIIVQRWSPMT